MFSSVSLVLRWSAATEPDGAYRQSLAQLLKYYISPTCNNLGKPVTFHMSMLVSPASVVRD